MNLPSALILMEAATLGEKRFRVLNADTNRQFTLKSTKLQEQDNLAIAQGNVALNLINVYRVLGGGWETRYEKEEAAGSEMGSLNLPCWNSVL